LLHATIADTHRWQGSLVRRAEDFYAVEHGDCLHTLTGPAAAPGVEAKLRDAADNVRQNRTALDDDAALAALDTQVRRDTMPEGGRRAELNSRLYTVCVCAGA